MLLNNFCFINLSIPFFISVTLIDMHPSKRPSVRHVLVLDFTDFIKFTISRSDRYYQILTLTKRVFRYQVNIFNPTVQNIT
jgi:hypothetical protein